MVRDARGGQQVAYRAFVKRAHQAELVQHRGAQVVEQPMQGPPHMPQDGVDRAADVFQPGLPQARFRQFHVGLDGGDVLPQFVVEFGGQVPALVFVGAQVAARGIAQLAGELVEVVIDRPHVGVLLGHVRAALAQGVGGRSQHDGAGTGHRQQQIGRCSRGRIAQAVLGQGNAHAGDQHGQAGSAPAMPEREIQDRCQRQHAGELRLGSGLSRQQKQDRHRRQHHQHAVDQQADQRPAVQSILQQHHHQGDQQENRQIMAEQLFAQCPQHLVAATMERGKRRGVGDRGGAHQHQHDQQQPRHLLGCIQCDLPAEPAHQPQAAGHHQHVRQFAEKETVPAGGRALVHDDAERGDTFRAQEPAPITHGREQQGAESQPVRQHPEWLRRGPQRQPRQQISEPQHRAETCREERLR